MNKIHFNKKGYKMSRSVFANTIGAFVLDGIPSHTHARPNAIDWNKAGSDLLAAGGEVVRDSAVDYVEDEYGSAAGVVAGQAIDAGYDRAGIPTSQQQQSVPQDYNPMLAAQAIAATRAPLASSGMFSQPRIDAQTVATAQGVLDAQRRVQQAQAFDAARRAGELLNQQSQVTGEDSQVTRTDKEKDEKKKPFFKTGAGIATILLGAAAIAGGIVYFATQE